MFQLVCIFLNDIHFFFLFLYILIQVHGSKQTEMILRLDELTNIHMTLRMHKFNSCIINRGLMRPTYIQLFKSLLTWKIETKWLMVFIKLFSCLEHIHNLLNLLIKFNLGSKSFFLMKRFKLDFIQV